MDQMLFWGVASRAISKDSLLSTTHHNTCGSILLLLRNELGYGRIVDMETAAQDAFSHVHDSKKKAFCIDDVIVTGMVDLADDHFYEYRVWSPKM